MLNSLEVRNIYESMNNFRTNNNLYKYYKENFWTPLHDLFDIYRLNDYNDTIIHDLLTNYHLKKSVLNYINELTVYSVSKYAIKTIHLNLNISFCNDRLKQGNKLLLKVLTVILSQYHLSYEFIVNHLKSNIINQAIFNNFILYQDTFIDYINNHSLSRKDIVACHKVFIQKPELKKQCLPINFEKFFLSKDTYNDYTFMAGYYEKMPLTDTFKKQIKERILFLESRKFISKI